MSQLIKVNAMNELCGVITDSSIVCPGPYWYFDSDLQEPVLIEYRLSISGYKEVLFLLFFSKTDCALIKIVAVK